MSIFGKLLLAIIFMLPLNAVANGPDGIRLKELSRFEGVRSNSLVGYGIVIGLANTGDSSRSRATVQSIANTLQAFGVTVDPNNIRSRNVAAVMVTATLPPFSAKGDKLDVNVSSIGDARSLVGGTLLLVPLKGPNGKTYGLAQGSLSVGGYKYDMNGNVIQKNHPTVARIPGGATVENETIDTIVNNNQNIGILLNKSDITTLQRVHKALKQALPENDVIPVHPGKIEVVPTSLDPGSLFNLMAKIESTTVYPDISNIIVINERTGTIVSGGNIMVSPTVISHGDLRVTIKTRYNVSQPTFIGRNDNETISTVIVPETDLKVNEDKSKHLTVQDGISVMELVEKLQALNLSTRDIITILQSLKEAGALHANLVLQ